MMLSGNGKLLVVIETVELTLRRFDEWTPILPTTRARTTEVSPHDARDIAATSPGWASSRKTDALCDRFRLWSGFSIGKPEAA